ncbi:MAG: hypothetical protein K0R25_276 [Rickettsiaceae bacterium]|jgi:multisubunit Na+/H+ antiporter MnhE subunit|nr:hypothetical protein [Rickettsiaceae bacterium]
MKLIRALSKTANNLLAMINIFNLFLTLFFFWILFSYVNGSLSWFYVFFGAASSLIVSIISWKLKIITKRSNFLFLSFGFYHHFFAVIFHSFTKSLKIAFACAFGSKKINPQIHELPLKKPNSRKSILLISTINLMAGLVFVGFKDDKIIICSLHENFIKQLDLPKLLKELNKVNDNRLT